MKIVFAKLESFIFGIVLMWGIVVTTAYVIKFKDEQVAKQKPKFDYESFNKLFSGFGGEKAKAN